MGRTTRSSRNYCWCRALALEHDKEYVKDLEALAHFNHTVADQVGRGLTVTGVIRLLKGWLRYRELAVTALLETPDDFVLGGQALEERIPDPPFRVVFERDLVNMPLDDERYWLHQWSIDPATGVKRSVISVAFDVRHQAPITAKQACQLYDELTLADIVLSPFERDFHEADIQVAKDWLGLQLLTVIPDTPVVPQHEQQIRTGYLYLPERKLWFPKRSWVRSD